jgi:hypothetical protein
MNNPMIHRIAYYRERILPSNTDGSPPGLLDCIVLEADPLEGCKHRVRYLWFGRERGLDGIDSEGEQDPYNGEFVATGIIPRDDDVECIRALAERTLKRFDAYRQLHNMPPRVVAAEPKLSFWRRLANTFKGNK